MELDWLVVTVDVTVDDTVDVCVLLSQTKRIPSALSCVPRFNASMLSTFALAFTVIASFSHANMSVESIKVSYSCIMRCSNFAAAVH